MLLQIIEKLALYAMPIVSFLLSVLAYIKSRDCTKVKLELTEVQEKLDAYDLKLKTYELEKIEKELEKKGKANIEARVVQIAKGKYKIKVWNSGDEKAYNIDYDIPEKYQIYLMKQITPFEYLEPGSNFEEFVSVQMNSERKFEIITFWENQYGEKFSNNILRSI